MTLIGPDDVAAEAAQPSADSQASALRRRVQAMTRLQELGLVLVLAGLFAYFALTAPDFLTSANIRTLLIYLSVLGVLAVGQTVVIVAGGFDLSNGANLAMASCIGATLLTHGAGQGTAAIVTLAVAVAIGVINGVLVGVLKINAFIATLATYLVVNGYAYVYTNSTTVSFNLNQWVVFGRGSAGPIPVPVLILLGTGAAVYFVMRSTVVGRWVYAVGGNQQAARVAGIPVARTIVVVFAISGLCAGIGALIQSSLSGAGSATYTGDLNLQSITAVILGGAALTGGEGTVVGTLLGVLIINTILDGMTLQNLSPFYQDIVTGFVLLLAVGLAVLRRRLAARG